MDVVDESKVRLAEHDPSSTVKKIQRMDNEEVLWLSLAL